LSSDPPHCPGDEASVRLDTLPPALPLQWANSPLQQGQVTSLAFCRSLACWLVTGLFKCTSPSTKVMQRRILEWMDH